MTGQPAPLADTIVDEIVEAVVAISTDGAVLFWNRGAEVTFGYGRDEAVGQPLAALVLPAGSQAELQNWQHGAMESGSARWEAAWRRRDGSRLAASIAANVVRRADGAVSHLVLSVRELSLALHHPDANLLETRMRGLLDAAPDAMVVVSQDGTILLVNAQTEALFGYPREELLGKPIEMLVPERLRQLHQGHRAGYVAGPRPRPMGAGLDLHGIRSDGSEIPVEISLSPLETEDGLVVISAIRDVTEQRAAAERARLLAQERSARAQAEEAVRARTEFLSVAAHELKTPITSLRVFAELLLRQLDDRGTVDPARLRLALETIDQQSSRLARLINQLLDLSRIEAGHLALSREHSDLMPLIRMVAASVQATTSRHAIQVHGPASAPAFADTLRIEQVLTNLLDNAVRYSPEGGEIAVEVTAPAPDLLQIAVRDHGVGVPAASSERIFDRFYQAQGASSTSGMGLGLYISRQIVELHGGCIVADTPPGGGARFTVTLPADRSAPRAGASLDPRALSQSDSSAGA